MLSRNIRYLESLSRAFRVVTRYYWCVYIAESLILGDIVNVRKSHVGQGQTSKKLLILLDSPSRRRIIAAIASVRARRWA
jgi:hypothetical protein